MKLLGNGNKRVRGGVALCAVAISALLGAAVVAPSNALAAISDQVPEHEKTLTDNGDGTYDLSLTVTGAVESSTTSTKADVVVVQDCSGSMSQPVRGLDKSELVQGKTYIGIGGLRNNDIYYEIFWGKVSFQPTYTWCYTANGYNYDYEKACHETWSSEYFEREACYYETTWNEVAKEALNTLGEQLIENNYSDVQVSVIPFSTQAQADDTVYKGGDSDNFSAMVEALTANGGSNWEDALVAAKQKLADNGRDGAKKYLVFVSDGLPTFRNSQGEFIQGQAWADSYDHGYYDQVEGRNDKWTSSSGKYGTGSSDKLGRDYNAAVEVANSIDSSVQKLLVNTSTDSAKMKQFASDTGWTYYEGNNEVDGYDEGTLKHAFAEIANLVTNTVSYENVKITDQLSDYVDFADVVNIRYEKIVDGVANDWSEAPEATVSGKTITWDLSGEGELEDGVTYKVTFTVKPS